MIKYFGGAFLFSLTALVLAGWVGYSASGTVRGGVSGAFICLVLIVLEISLSFDNAVINASVLKDMSPLWQKRFLTWGMMFAVFGMRLVFPLLIVGVSAHLWPVEAVSLAVYHPDTYARILAESHTALMGFGGAFLAMVGLRFLGEEKEIYWLTRIERPLAILGRAESFAAGLVLLALWGVASLLPGAGRSVFLISGLAGIIAFVVVEVMNSFLAYEEKTQLALNTGVKLGLAGFLTLEVMDASFSFDGVVGAFALSGNLFIIVLGLGAGAFFVRSLTIMLVRTGHLRACRYLEHGAFWAVLALAIMMFISVVHAVPDIITGGVGLALITASCVSSIKWQNRKKCH